MGTQASSGIKLVVFNWTGTLLDHGSLAPVQAVQAVFSGAGLHISKAQIRGLIGLSRRDLITNLLRAPSVLRSFESVRGRAPTSADIDALCAAFVPAQLAAIHRHHLLIDGAAAAVATLRDIHIAVATISRHSRPVAELVRDYARRQGLEADFNICIDDVPPGGPAPSMIGACMQALQVSRPREVLVVGDTPLDILCAREAGCLNVGVAGTGNEVGHSRLEWQQLTLSARNAALENAHHRLRDAGADFVIDTLYELPLVIRRIAERGLSSAA